MDKLIPFLRSNLKKIDLYFQTMDAQFKEDPKKAQQQIANRMMLVSFFLWLLLMLTTAGTKYL